MCTVKLSGRMLSLSELLGTSSNLPHFQPPLGKLQDLDVLHKILNWEYKDVNGNETFIFLDCDLSSPDSKQVIRKIKDILSRHHLDSKFFVSMVFVSQIVQIPQALERLGELVFFETEEKSIRTKVSKLAKSLEITEPSEEVISNLKGLTLFEVEQAFAQRLAIVW